MAIFNSQSNAPKKDQPSFAADTPASVPPREAPAVADFTPNQVTLRGRPRPSRWPRNR